MTLAYLSTPILGIVDTAVIGRLGDAALLGGIAVGAIIFDLIFTTFNCLRSSTTGMTAQALGAGNDTELRATLYRLGRHRAGMRHRGGGAASADTGRFAVVHGRQRGCFRGDLGIFLRARPGHAVRAGELRDPGLVPGPGARRHRAGAAGRAQQPQHHPQHLVRDGPWLGHRRRGLGNGDRRGHDRAGWHRARSARAARAAAGAARGRCSTASALPPR